MTGSLRGHETTANHVISGVCKQRATINTSKTLYLAWDQPQIPIWTSLDNWVRKWIDLKTSKHSLSQGLSVRELLVVRYGPLSLGLYPGPGWSSKRESTGKRALSRGPSHIPLPTEQETQNSQKNKILSSSCLPLKALVLLCLHIPLPSPFCSLQNLWNSLVAWFHPEALKEIQSWVLFELLRCLAYTPSRFFFSWHLNLFTFWGIPFHSKESIRRSEQTLKKPFLQSLTLLWCISIGLLV